MTADTGLPEGTKKGDPDEWREYEAHCRGISEGVTLAIQMVEECRKYTSELFPNNTGRLTFVDIRRVLRALETLNVHAEEPAGEATPI